MIYRGLTAMSRQGGVSREMNGMNEVLVDLIV
jgi:hypothetical protein